MCVAFQYIFYDPTNIPTWTLERIRNVWLTLKSLLTWHYPLFWIRIMSCSRYNDVAWTWHWYDWSASNSFLFHVCYQHFIIMWWWCPCQLQNWQMRLCIYLWTYTKQICIHFIWFAEVAFKLIASLVDLLTVHDIDYLRMMI